MNDLTKLWPQLPVWYDKDGGYILDASGSMVVEIRGWGRMTGIGAGGLGLSGGAAQKLQDDFANKLVTFINGGMK